MDAMRRSPAAILNQDHRATEEAAWIEATLGRKCLFEITGLVAHPMYPVPKILWLRKHRAELFASSVRFLTVIGYLLSRLGLPAYIDYSLASRYLAFDIRRREWSSEILAATEVNPEWLPVAVPAGTIAGKLDAAAASQLGLSFGTMVVMGGHDQPCGALGVGAIGAGRVADSMGTYECLAAASDQPSLTDAALAASLNSYCHVVPEKFITLAYFPSGIMMKWFHDLLYGEGCGEDCGEGTGDSFDDESLHYAAMERGAPAGPTGLCVTPNLIGTCNPDFNPHVRGIISGLSSNSSRNQIYKGILEGLACELAQMTEILTSAVGEFQGIFVTGGGSRSVLGLQLRAALSGRRLHVMKSPEACAWAGPCLRELQQENTGACGKLWKCWSARFLLFLRITRLRQHAQQVKQYRHLRSALTAITN